jgi:hypothetical protein
MSMVVLVATWDDGLRVVADGKTRHELAGQPVRGLASDNQGAALAIVGGSSLCRRGRDGNWSTIAVSTAELACCMAVGTSIYAGTEDARVLRANGTGTFEEISAFQEVAGRARWYAGSAVIDGRRMGPPLGIRSMTASCDQATLLVNVHVGGIPRSEDAGASWQPTVDIDCDVHQVRAHPTRPEIVAAAAGAGFCLSRDAGRTWSIEQQGLHASYCSAVAFAGNDVLVAASTDHFASQGAVYRRPLDDDEPMRPVGGGLPAWLEGIADTDNLVANGTSVVVADHSGNLYLSEDAGRTWSRGAAQLGVPSSVFVY